MAGSSGSTGASSGGLVVAGVADSEVADDLVVAQDCGVVGVDDDGDGAGGPFGSDSDAEPVQVDCAAIVHDHGVGFGARLGVR